MADGSRKTAVCPIYRHAKKKLLSPPTETHLEISSDSESLQPPQKKVKRAEERFPDPTTSEELAGIVQLPILSGGELGPGARYKQAVVPKNTQKNDQWAMTTFTEWMEQRNARVTSEADRCPADILDTTDAASLARWLSLFTIEVRKRDGTKFPPSSINMLLMALQRLMRRNNPHPFDIFDRRDIRFQDFHGTMESMYQSLRNEGIGTDVKRIQFISSEEEALVWQRRVLGDHTPLALVRGVFFLNGKNLCLRGGKDHRELRLSQFINHDDKYWVFTNEEASRSSRREYQIIPHPEAGAMCHAHLLKVYFSKLPPTAKKKGAFYFSPVRIRPCDPKEPWFTDTPIGWNKLDRFVRDIFAEVGIAGKSNHSLRVTGATQLYKNGIPESTIQARTGLKSLKALRMYERMGRSGGGIDGGGTMCVTNGGGGGVSNGAGGGGVQNVFYGNPVGTPTMYDLSSPSGFTCVAIPQAPMLHVVSVDSITSTGANGATGGNGKGGGEREAVAKQDTSVVACTSSSDNVTVCTIEGGTTETGAMETTGGLGALIDDKTIAFIARNMKNWESLKLVNEAEAIEIQKDCQKYRDQKKEALAIWKENNESEATVNNLIAAFIAAGDTELAETTRNYVARAT